MGKKNRKSKKMELRKKNGKKKHGRAKIMDLRKKTEKKSSKKYQEVFYIRFFYIYVICFYTISVGLRPGPNFFLYTANSAGRANFSKVWANFFLNIL